MIVLQNIYHKIKSIVNYSALVQLQHAMDYMNKTPKKSHDTDFLRVRMWCINKW